MGEGEAMIVAFNALLECFVTGLFTALALWALAKFGLFPVIMMVPYEEDGKEE